MSRTIWLRLLPENSCEEPLDVPIHTGSGLGLGTGAWSPDGARLSFNAYYNSVDWEVWTIKADGTNATKVLASTGTTNYGGHGWSPSGLELLIHSTKSSIDLSKYQYQLLRMPAKGGKLTALTGDLPPTSYKEAAAWLPLGP